MRLPKSFNNFKILLYVKFIDKKYYVNFSLHRRSIKSRNVFSEFLHVPRSYIWILSSRTIYKLLTSHKLTRSLKSNGAVIKYRIKAYAIKSKTNKKYKRKTKFLNEESIMIVKAGLHVIFYSHVFISVIISSIFEIDFIFIL